MNRLYRGVPKRTIRGQATHLYQTMALPERVASTAKRLELLKNIFGRLFADEHFVTLLRAESITTVPGYLAPLPEKARGSREAF